MKLHIISLYYAPEETGNAPYAAGLAEHLAGRGHDVAVVTGLPHYPSWRTFDGYHWRAWHREKRNGVDVHRRWHYVPTRQSAIHRGLYEGSFLLTGSSMIALPRPDAVVGVVPSLSGGVLARLAGRRFRVPYGLIFQDLVGQAAKQSGVGGGGRVAGGVRAVEGWAARGAAAVGIIAEGFRPYLESLGVDTSRIHRVLNWTHVEAPSMDRGLVREGLGLPKDAAICIHAGNMGYKQNLGNVIECARLAAERDGRLLFVLMGDGNQRPYLEGLASQYKLRNVRFLPLQSKAFFPNALAAADLLLVNQRGTVGDMSLPGKLTAYFISGQPVVAAVARDSETAREVASSEAGVVVEPDDPKALLDAIDGLLGDPARCNRLGAAGKRCAKEKLAPAAALRGYESFIEALVAADSSDRRPTLRAAA